MRKKIQLSNFAIKYPVNFFMSHLNQQRIAFLFVYLLQSIHHSNKFTTFGVQERIQGGAMIPCYVLRGQLIIWSGNIAKFRYNFFAKTNFGCCFATEIWKYKQKGSSISFQTIVPEQFTRDGKMLDTVLTTFTVLWCNIYVGFHSFTDTIPVSPYTGISRE